VFAERDPYGYAGSPNQHLVLAGNPVGAVDPLGLFQDWVLTREYKVQGGQARPNDSQDVPEVNIDYLAPWLSEAAQKAVTGLLKQDLGPGAGRQVLEELLSKLADWAARASGGNPATDFLAEIALGLAEKYDGTGGASIEGAAALAGFGGHFGLNMQAFPPQRGSSSTDYRVGFYGFETLKNLSEKEMMNKIEEGHKAESIFAPGGAFGVLASVGIGLDVAMAFQQNTPANWKGFFHTVSASWDGGGGPLPTGASGFYSRSQGRLLYAGGEVSWGQGVGVAWSKPYYHMWAALRMDRPTVKTLLSGALARAF